MKAISIFILFWLSTVVWAEPIFHVPQGTNLKQRLSTAEEAVVFFEGRIPLKGLLRVRWAGEFGDRYLHLDFMPDAQSQRALPYALDVYNKAEKLIVLNDMASDETNKKLVEQLFDGGSQHFWRFQEGVLEQAVAITIGNLSVNGECDQRCHYAEVLTHQAISKTSAVFKEDACEPFAMTILFTVSSKDGYANLRAKPTVGAKVLRRIKTNELLVRLKTIDEYWFLVDAGEGVQGYIHRSQVKPAN